MRQHGADGLITLPLIELDHLRTEREELLAVINQLLDETGRECYCSHAPVEYSCGRCAAKKALSKSHPEVKP